MHFCIHVQREIIQGNVPIRNSHLVLVACRLGPNLSTLASSEDSLPMLKWTPPKSKNKGETPDPVPEAADEEPLPGYSYAVHSRRKAMQDAGMQTALPSMSKDQRKAEKDKKKALLNAKHLLR